MIPLLKTGKNGFTLIEIIATILVAAVIGAVIFQYMGTSLTQSSMPIHRLKKALALQEVIESITDDYEQSAKDATALATLQTNITNGNYTTGDHTVVTNSIIDLDAGNPNDPQLLKVTIRNNDSGETLTALFSVQS